MLPHLETSTGSPLSSWQEAARRHSNRLMARRPRVGSAAARQAAAPLGSAKVTSALPAANRSVCRTFATTIYSWQQNNLQRHHSLPCSFG